MLDFPKTDNSQKRDRDDETKEWRRIMPIRDSAAREWKKGKAGFKLQIGGVIHGCNEERWCYCSKCNKRSDYS